MNINNSIPWVNKEVKKAALVSIDKTGKLANDK